MNFIINAELKRRVIDRLIERAVNETMRTFDLDNHETAMTLRECSLDITAFENLCAIVESTAGRVEKRGDFTKFLAEAGIRPFQQVN